MRQGADLEEGIWAAKRAAQTAEKKMSYVAAARRISELLTEAKARRDAAKSETCAPGKETIAEEPVTEERDEERNAVAPAPSAPPVTSVPPPSAEPPAAPPADPRPWRSRPDRYARHRSRESTPSPGVDSRAGRLHNKLLRNRCLHRRTGNSAHPLKGAWKKVTSHVPAQPAAKIRKLPVKFAVLRERGRRSRGGRPAAQPLRSSIQWLVDASCRRMSRAY